MIMNQNRDNLISNNKNMIMNQNRINISTSNNVNINYMYTSPSSMPMNIKIPIQNTYN